MYFLKNKYFWFFMLMKMVDIEGSVREHRRQQTTPSLILHTAAQSFGEETVHAVRTVGVFGADESAIVRQQNQALIAQNLQLKDEKSQLMATISKLQKDNERLRLRAECWAGVSCFVIGVYLGVWYANALLLPQNPQKCLMN